MRGCCVVPGEDREVFLFGRDSTSAGFGTTLAKQAALWYGACVNEAELDDIAESFQCSRDMCRDREAGRYW